MEKMSYIWVLDTRCSMLDAEYRMLVAGYFYFLKIPYPNSSNQNLDHTSNYNLKINRLRWNNFEI